MAELKNFYVQNLEGWQKTLSSKKLLDKELEVKVVERGIVLPVRKIDGVWKGGVCDNDFNFVAGFSRIKPTEKYFGRGGLLNLHTLSTEKNSSALTRTLFSAVPWKDISVIS